ncbi:hypothetical protein DPMN_144792 [Dreissena polymorpha]|uniref:Uncharacterized protein n=1 Tax=Dreissena polymorpha TaxID=45954 RepID=A0A9D4F4S0_DREPO|nr:hypothetical protein DPMN_144792 [Dreissena polymorpha]
MSNITPPQNGSAPSDTFPAPTSGVSPSGIASPFPGYYVAPHLQYLIQNPGSPVFSFEQSQQPSACANTSIDQGLYSEIMNKLCSIEKRQKSMDSKLGKLEHIKADIKIFNKMSVIECRVSTLDLKLTVTENKLMEIERSRSFDSQNCDELKSQLKHFEKLVSGQCEHNKILSGKIDSLNSLNSQLSEDIIDLQSRSMRDNLLFFQCAGRAIV